MCNQPKIFIVDDNELICGLLAELVQETGYSAETYLSAEDFLAAAEYTNYDILIVDMQLSGMSGIELKQKINRSSIRLFIIFISGYDLASIRLLAGNDEWMAFLQKPFDEHELLTIIQDFSISQKYKR